MPQHPGTGGGGQQRKKKSPNRRKTSSKAGAQRASGPPGSARPVTRPGTPTRRVVRVSTRQSTTGKASPVRRTRTRRTL